MNKITFTTRIMLSLQNVQHSCNGVQPT